LSHNIIKKIIVFNPIDLVLANKKTLENTKETIKNGQSRETGTQDQ